MYALPASVRGVPPSPAHAPRGGKGAAAAGAGSPASASVGGGEQQGQYPPLVVVGRDAGAVDAALATPPPGPPALPAAGAAHWSAVDCGGCTRVVVGASAEGGGGEGPVRLVFVARARGPVARAHRALVDALAAAVRDIGAAALANSRARCAPHAGGGGGGGGGALHVTGAAAAAHPGLAHPPPLPMPASPIVSLTPAVTAAIAGDPTARAVVAAGAREHAQSFATPFIGAAAAAIASLSDDVLLNEFSIERGRCVCVCCGRCARE